jgi:hypothetical protein
MDAWHVSLPRLAVLSQLDQQRLTFLLYLGGQLRIRELFGGVLACGESVVNEIPKMPVVSNTAIVPRDQNACKA